MTSPLPGLRGVDVSVRIEFILNVIRVLRPPVITEEIDLQELLARHFARSGIPSEREKRLGPHERIDFLILGVGIECKKEAPNATRLGRQIRRYCSHPEVDALIVVAPRRYHLPRVDHVDGKRVVLVSLNELWGVAI